MKKSLTLSAAVLCFAGLFSSSAMAVDGYKNLKFGMSKKEVMASKMCSLVKSLSDHPNTEYYSCDDFLFGGKKTNAGVFFIDGKLMRVAILQSIDMVPGLMSQLSQKYGETESDYEKKDFDEIDTKPNKTLDINFDNKTVTLRLMSDENYNKRAVVMYSSSDFYNQLAKFQQESIKNDL